MPKIVDHAARREQLAAALWRVVVRDGVEAASLRRVAAEAGWSVGSLRHYFETQADLLHFAMELVVTRVTDRVAALPQETDPVAAATGLLHQFLPLDADRRAEMEVWLAFASRALVDPSLRELRDEAHTGVRGVCRRAVELLGAARPRARGRAAARPGGRSRAARHRRSRRDHARPPAQAPRGAPGLAHAMQPSNSISDS